MKLSTLVPLAFAAAALANPIPGPPQYPGTYFQITAWSDINFKGVSAGSNGVTAAPGQCISFAGIGRTTSSISYFPMIAYGPNGENPNGWTCFIFDNDHCSYSGSHLTFHEPGLSITDLRKYGWNDRALSGYCREGQ